MQQLQPTIREFDLPAGAVPAADRGQPDRPADLRVRDLGRPEAVLRPLGRPGRPARPRPAPAVRRRRARRRLRRRLHGPPARQLPPGRAARSRARPRLPARGGPPPLRRDGARRAERAADAGCCASRRTAPAGCSRRRRLLRERIGGRVGRAVGLFARGGLAALEALEDAGWDIFTQRPRPSRLRLARERCARDDDDVEQAYAEVERLTRARARNFAYGIMVLPRPKRRAIAAIYAFAREVDDIADGDAPPTRSARGSRSSTGASTRRRATRRCGSRSPTRAGASRSPRRRCTTSSTAG